MLNHSRPGPTFVNTKKVVCKQQRSCSPFETKSKPTGSQKHNQSSVCGIEVMYFHSSMAYVHHLAYLLKHSHYKRRCHAMPSLSGISIHVPNAKSNMRAKAAMHAREHNM